MTARLSTATDASASVAELSRFFVRCLKARFRDHRTEFSAIRAHVRPRDTVCDIGSNKGAFLYWLARWCHDGRVVAFEPQRELADRLSGICNSIHLHNVQVEAKAVSAASGTGQLIVPRGHAPGASLNPLAMTGVQSHQISVPVVALDDYFSEQETISFLKVDVEGCELDVFRGAERILTRSNPLLLFECEGRHLAGGSVHDVFSHLQARGYRGRFVANGSLLPLSDFNEAIHQSRDGDWFWKKRGYYNNFLFAKP